MRVKDLIKELNGYDPYLEVVIARDSEGNSFQFLDGIEAPMIFDDGEVYLCELSEEDREMGFTDEDLYPGKNGTKCLVLWP